MFITRLALALGLVAAQVYAQNCKCTQNDCSTSYYNKCKSNIHNSQSWDSCLTSEVTKEAMGFMLWGSKLSCCAVTLISKGPTPLPGMTKCKINDSMCPKDGSECNSLWADCYNVANYPTKTLQDNCMQHFTWGGKATDCCLMYLEQNPNAAPPAPKPTPYPTMMQQRPTARPTTYTRLTPKPTPRGKRQTSEPTAAVTPAPVQSLACKAIAKRYPNNVTTGKRICDSTLGCKSKMKKKGTKLTCKEEKVKCNKFKKENDCLAYSWACRAKYKKGKFKSCAKAKRKGL